MSENDARNLRSVIRPDAVDDDQVVPGRGVDQRDQGEDTQQNQQARANLAAQQDGRDDQGNYEEDGKELGIGHEPSFLLRRFSAAAVRAIRGYQHGVLAMVPAAVIASAVAVLTQMPSPLEAVAEHLMELTPVGIAEYLLSHLLSVARPASLLGALAIAMLAGGLAGSLHAFPVRRLWGQVAGLGLAAAFLGAVFIGVFTPVELAPELWLIAAYLASLVLISRSTRHVPGRAEFLRRSVIIIGGAVALLALYSARPLLGALTVRRFFPYRRPHGLPIPGLADLVTSPDQFFIMDKVLEYPLVGSTAWYLTVDGAVARPLRLKYDVLTGRPAESRYVTVECVDNPVGGSLISNALWTGVRVTDLLREAGATGNTVLFHAADSYAEPVPRHVLADAGALIAYAMNGETLPRAHGYPARLLLPGFYGFKSVKWLTRIEVVDGPAEGHWASYGWTPTARIHSTVRIDIARRSGEEVLLAGIAFGGNRGISAIEVRVAGGAWRRARLGSALSRDSWVQWALRLRASAGVVIEARVMDGNGEVQTAQRHGAYPDGSTGWAAVTV